MIENVAVSRGRIDRDDPNLLIQYLRYALADVRAHSERSGRHLENAIAALAEDTSLIELSGTNGAVPHSS